MTFAKQRKIYQSFVSQTPPKSYTSFLAIKRPQNLKSHNHSTKALRPHRFLAKESLKPKERESGFNPILFMFWFLKIKNLRSENIST